LRILYVVVVVVVVVIIIIVIIVVVGGVVVTVVKHDINRLSKTNHTEHCALIPKGANVKVMKVL